MPNQRINGIDLYYEIHGQGMPLMLVAGLASDSQSWQPIVEDLSRHYQVILPDNRGVGRTTPQDIDISIAQISDDCVALIQYLGLPAVNLLGHSMGGLVAMDCAIRYPAHVSKLILVGTSAFNSARNNALFLDWVSYLDSGMDLELWFRNIFYWIFTEPFFQDPAVLQQALQFLIDYPYPQSQTAFKNQVKAIAEFSCLHRLADIKAETLIVCGAQDRLFPPEQSIEVLREIPGAVTSIIDEAAHSVHMENPAAFCDAVLQFLTPPGPLA